MFIASSRFATAHLQHAPPVDVSEISIIRLGTTYISSFSLRHVRTFLKCLENLYFSSIKQLFIRIIKVSTSITLPIKMTSLVAIRSTQLIYAVVGCVFLGRLIWTLWKHPLFPFFPTDDDQWAGAWLITTIFDYFTLVVCLSTIILWTEESVVIGICWVLAINLLGSLFACIYLILRLEKANTVQLSNRPVVDSTNTAT